MLMTVKIMVMIFMFVSVVFVYYLFMYLLTFSQLEISRFHLNSLLWVQREHGCDHGRDHVRGYAHDDDALRWPTFPTS